MNAVAAIAVLVTLAFQVVVACMFWHGWSNFLSIFILGNDLVKPYDPKDCESMKNAPRCRVLLVIISPVYGDAAI